MYSPFRLTALGVLVCLIFAIPSFADIENSLKKRILIRKNSHWEAVEFSDSDQYDNAKVEEITKKREILITQLSRLLSETRTENLRVEIGLRLGKLYREKYYLELEKAYRAFERSVAEFEENKGAGMKPLPPNNTRARIYLDRALEVFTDLKRQNLNTPRRDQILYYYATAQLEHSNRSKAMEAFNELAKRFPGSPFSTEALIELGDNAFDKNRFAVAEHYYDEVIHRRFQPLLTYVTYKKAWCAWDLGRKSLTLSLLKWIIQNEQNLPSTRLKIRNEAIHDIPLAFAELRRFQEGLLFFQNFPEPEYRTGLETMAELYHEQGDQTYAIKLWNNLISLNPNYFKNPVYELNIVAALETQGQHGEAMKRLISNSGLYLAGSDWSRANTPRGSHTPDGRKLFEEALRSYSLKYHATAQKLKKAQYYELARMGYSRYLELFPNSTESSKMRLNLAEILYHEKRFAQSAEEYANVYRALPDGALKKDSMRRSLAALDMQLNMDRKGKGLTQINDHTTAVIADDSKANGLIPYSSAESKFLEVSGEYLAKSPRPQDTPDVLYERSYLEYQHHDFVAAKNGFDQIIAEYPRHETAPSAVRLNLDIIARTGDASQTEAYARQLLTNGNINQPTLRHELGSIVRRTELRRAQKLEEEKSFSAAGDSYVAFVQTFGNQDRALSEKALYNAAVNYKKAGNTEKYLQCLETFTRQYPKSALNEDIELQLAKAYEAMARFEKAAPAFDTLATRYPRNPQAKYALRLAGLYYWGSGERAKAEQSMKRYMERFPEESSLVEADLMNVYIDSGAINKAIRLQAKLRADKKISAVEYVQHTLKQADLVARKTGILPHELMEEAFAKAKKFDHEMLKTRTGIESYSRVLFWKAEADESKYYRVRLSRSGQDLEKALTRKVAALKKIESEYAKIASYGSPNWGLGSLYKTAVMYRHLAVEVMQSPIPKDLTGKALDTYRNEINQKMIQPFNQKAMGFTDQCLAKSDDLKALSSWTSQCYALASQLAPNKYPPVHTFYLPAFQTSSVIPDTADDSKMTNTRDYPYETLASGLFDPAAPMDRLSVASLETNEVEDAMGINGDSMSGVPNQTSYRTLNKQRHQYLKAALAEEKTNTTKPLSFRYLNLLRLEKPTAAIGVIRTAIEHDPKDLSLHNLLGLAYLELHNLPAAKVVWLSMIARGIESDATWNNLGVVSNLEGNEKAALEYFAKVKEDDAKEAWLNAGFLALKYRNGGEANRWFKKALNASKEDRTAYIGLWNANTQERKFDDCHSEVSPMIKTFAMDPYAQLSVGYFLMDIDKQSREASKRLASFVSFANVRSDVQFERALNRARELAAKNELPVTVGEQSPAARAASSVTSNSDSASEDSSSESRKNNSSDAKETSEDESTDTK